MGATAVGLLSAWSVLAGCGGGPSSSEETIETTAAAVVAESFNRPGNVLIADQFNNRVIEVNPVGDIVWHFGRGPNDVTAKSIVGVNDTERVGELTLMAGTGVPMTTPPSEPLCAAGCADNRVILVDREGQILWQYGQFGVTGAEDNELNTPVQATFLPNRHVLITDQGNARVIDVSIDTKKIVWQYGITGTTGMGHDQLNNPNSAELLANGNILIADENNNRAIEVTRRKKIVGTFTADGTVSGVAFASRLADGHTLLTDSNNGRIVEVDENDHIVWQYSTMAAEGNAMPLPTRAARLQNGDTLISDQFNHRVIEVGRKKSIVARYGNLNMPGYGTMTTKQGLNAPYDAKVIGDYTGLTPPFGHDFD
jgi:hypothetical protein